MVKPITKIIGELKKILRYYDDGEWVEEIFSFPNDPSVLGKKIHEFKIN